jgi:hypothetical protein
VNSDIANKKSKTEYFSRYEFKYLLNAEACRHIESEVSHFMRYDGHVHPELKNRYYVTSLYFDNPSSSHYYEKIDGLRIRTKFRIRTYAPKFEEGLPTYLELKGRHIDRVFKHRIAIRFEHLPLFLEPEESFKLLDLYPDNWLIQRFVYEIARKNIAPVVVVEYLRRPYTCDFDLNFRATFDSKLKAARSKTLFLSEKENWISSAAGYTILEIKLHRRIPKWFHKILQANNLKRLSISKFCNGMETCNIATNLS